MRRDGALIERFSGRALVLGELLLIWYQRGIGYARQVGLTLLSLRFAALALLPLNRLGPRLLVGRVVWSINHVVMATSLPPAGIALVRVLVRLAALALAVIIVARPRALAALALALPLPLALLALLPLPLSLALLALLALLILLALLPLLILLALLALL